MTTESSTDATATDESAATAAAHPKLALLRDLLDGHTDRHDERAILDLLAGADAADLDRCSRAWTSTGSSATSTTGWWARTTRTRSSSSWRAPAAPS